MISQVYLSHVISKYALWITWTLGQDFVIWDVFIKLTVYMVYNKQNNYENVSISLAFVWFAKWIIGLSLCSLNHTHCIWHLFVWFICILCNNMVKIQGGKPTFSKSHYLKELIYFASRDKIYGIFIYTVCQIITQHSFPFISQLNKMQY